MIFSPSAPTGRGYCSAVKVKVIVTPKATVLDPQGAAVREAMQHLGFSAAREVRIGRYMEIDIDGDPAAHEAKLRELCRDLLSNPVIEDYRIEMPNGDVQKHVPPMPNE